MKATDKAPGIDAFLTSITGDNRVEAVGENRCIKPPIGCGRVVIDSVNPDPANVKAGGFRDQLSRKEYTISGLCQNCQDQVFGGEE